jgi:hypothetical protein
MLDYSCSGLFLTGQDIFYGGIAGASYTGLMTASAVLERNTLLDLELLRRTFPASEKRAKKMQ